MSVAELLKKWSIPLNANVTVRASDILAPGTHVRDGTTFYVARDVYEDLKRRIPVPKDAA